MQILKKHWRTFLAGGLVLAGICSAPTLIPIGQAYRVNHQFDVFTDTLFTADVSGNALNLHYTLAHPEELGITEYSASLGCFDPAQVSAGRIAYENRRSALEAFPYELLNQENRLTRDILCLAYETELLPGNNYLLEEYLSPSLGSQAQLPVLLAEYTFRREQDVQDYLKLLASVDTYFQGILTFEQLKSQNGTFMSDQTVERIVSQCAAFIENPAENYLASVFEEKLSELAGLSEKKRQAYGKLHDKILLEQVLPAYQSLIDGLYLLKGTGKNAGGLCGFTGGRAYYEYLLKSNCGIYKSVGDIQTRLLQQLQLDMSECGEIINRNPGILDGLSHSAAEAFASFTSASVSVFNSESASGDLFSPSEGSGAVSGDSSSHAADPNGFDESSPQEILEDLQEKLIRDFPEAPDTSYEVKYVHQDLENYLSPAFYLTPPIDTLSPNDIYINRCANLTGIQLFTTLAHEGFPGHLYQTVTFASTDPPRIRHVLNMSGYVEGWATYVETYAYGYADADPDLARLEWLNRSLNLCLLSLLDTGIHYDGWDRSKAAEFLANFGITNPDTQEEIYQVIVEDPANYLKYYMGYLHFLDLRESKKAELGDDFDIREFHRKILEIGPCQFPVLEKYL